MSMSMSNHTANAGAGVGVGGAMDVNAILWMKMGEGMVSTTWYATLGTIIQSIVVSSILSNSVRYFEYFTRTDSIWLLEAVAVGALMALGTLALTCAQAYKLIHMDESNIASHFRFLMLADMSHLLIGAIFNAAAGCYYAYRAWRMSRNKWWIIPPFALGLTAQFVVAIIAVANGLKMPPFTRESVMDLPAFMGQTIQWFKAWGAITLGVDGSLCIFMTFMLFKSKQGIFHNQTKLFKKLLSLIYETMLPPVICLIILEATSKTVGSPLTDFRRLFTSVLPVLYYHSTLQTLVGRQSIRNILDTNLAQEGIEVYSGSGSGSNHGLGSGARGTKSGGRVYVSRPRGDGAEKDYELDSVKTPSSGGPFIKIETEQQISGPDHIIVPYQLGKHSVNRSPISPSWEGHAPNEWESTDRLYPPPDSSRNV